MPVAASYRRRPRAPGGRRAGQALVEFALVLPILVALFMGAIETSRYLNIYISANRVCQRAAWALAAPDVTATRSPTAAVRHLRRQLRGPEGTWNPAYAPLILAIQSSREEVGYLEADVNLLRQGVRYSSIRLVLDLPPMMIPTIRAGGAEYGRVRLVGRGMAANEMQGVRRDYAAPYVPARFPLETLLEPVQAPLPALPDAAGGP